MHKLRTILPFLVLLIAILALNARTVAAAPGPNPQTTDAFWQASYWNNLSLSGEPVLQRVDG